MYNSPIFINNGDYHVVMYTGDRKDKIFSTANSDRGMRGQIGLEEPLSTP